MTDSPTLAVAAGPSIDGNIANNVSSPASPSLPPLGALLIRRRARQHLTAAGGRLRDDGARRGHCVR